ncbi:MAG: phosphatidate cytidylyltransferase [Oscillospiraceae bacterium]|nr:phosphatidate cytidylyltransferase [Oscillospiraceae bacterium]
MKAKVISGILGALFGITMLILQFTPVFSIVVAFFTFMANFELLRTAGVKNKGIYALTSVAATAIPFILEYDLTQYLPVPTMIVFLLYVFVLVLMMLKSYETTRFEHVSMALVSSLLVPYLISLLIAIRDFGDFPRSTNVYLTLFALTNAWITDSMAYFFGSKFGKHKMAPKISPKKSWEGAVGGVFGNIVVNMIVWGVFYLLYKLELINKVMFPLWLVPIASVILAVIGMLGDLSASAIKRNYGVKDYGTIMGEGQGGVMDRFDSAVFVIGAMYAFLQIYGCIALR